MAHLIDFSNNRANIAFQGETPWHKLGSMVNKDDPLEVWLEKGGLNWEAIKSPVYYKDQEQNLIEGDSKVIYRSDTKAQLGVVTDRYQVVQPKQVVEFYRDLVGVNGWHLDVVGSLDGGKKVWALAKTEQSFNVLGTVDKVDTFLLLATSFDGKMATIGKFSSCRVVCNNTLTMSLGDSLARISVGHNTVFNADKMKRELGLVVNATEQLEREANILAKAKIGNKDAVNFLVKVLAGDDAVVEDFSTRQANIIKGVFDLYNGRGKGSTMASSEGTAWGLLNSITEYVDHHQGSNDNNRLRNSWLGQGELLKVSAKNQLLAMVA